MYFCNLWFERIGEFMVLHIQFILGIQIQHLPDSSFLAYTGLIQCYILGQIFGPSSNMNFLEIFHKFSENFPIQNFEEKNCLILISKLLCMINVDLILQ